MSDSILRKTPNLLSAGSASRPTSSWYGPSRDDFDNQPPRLLETTPAPVQSNEELKIKGCVFAKSDSLPDGVINHSNPNGFVPVELLKQYGTYAVLGTAINSGETVTPLKWISGSSNAWDLLKKLGGHLAVRAPANKRVTVCLLLANNKSTDSALYTPEQYAELTHANTRTRLWLTPEQDGQIGLYGFYTGGHANWQMVPVARAHAQGEQLVADTGEGVEIIWSLADEVSKADGIPALEGASLKSGVWVYPPTKQVEKMLVDPVYPPDYRDLIVWFPKTQIPPLYLSLRLDEC